MARAFLKVWMGGLSCLVMIGPRSRSGRSISRMNLKTFLLILVPIIVSQRTGQEAEKTKLKLVQ
jgi:hypothetical protein